MYNPDEAPSMATVKGLRVRFHLHPVKDQAKTVEQGRPIYVMREYVEIKFMGDSNEVINRPASPEDKQKYAAAYAAFLAQGEQVKDGTPLNLWPMLNAAEVLELNGVGFYTIEKLAEQEGGESSFIREKAQRAKQYIAVAKDNSELLRLQEELKSVTQERDTLRMQVGRLEEAAKAVAA